MEMMDTNNNKPKRPLSAYNLFFQWERERILQGRDHLQLPIERDDLIRLSRARQTKPKRAHRKTHGKISFRELARTIADRWKQASEEDRALCEDQARVERQAYDRLIEDRLSRSTEKEEAGAKSPQRSANAMRTPTPGQVSSSTTVTSQMKSHKSNVHGCPLSESNRLQAEIQQEDIEAVVRKIQDELSNEQQHNNHQWLLSTSTNCISSPTPNHQICDEEVIAVAPQPIQDSIQDIDSAIRALEGQMDRELLTMGRPVLSTGETANVARASQLLANEMSTEEADSSFNWGTLPLSFLDQEASPLVLPNTASSTPFQHEKKRSRRRSGGEKFVRRTSSTINFGGSQLCLLEGFLDATEMDHLF